METYNFRLRIRCNKLADPDWMDENRTYIYKALGKTNPKPMEVRGATSTEVTALFTLHEETQFLAVIQLKGIGDVVRQELEDCREECDDTQLEESDSYFIVIEDFDPEENEQS